MTAFHVFLWRQGAFICVNHVRAFDFRRFELLMREVPVVDLEGTLLRSDSLFERFRLALGRDWKSPFGSASALLHGKTALKAYPARAAELDVTTLPRNEAVISYMKAWRGSGGRTALVTASHDLIAQTIAARLGLFDDVPGTSGTENLKGTRKAEFLVAQYRDGHFAYMGDSEADLAVWRRAKRAITANASDAARRRDGDRTSPDAQAAHRGSSQGHQAPPVDEGSHRFRAHDRCAPAGSTEHPPVASRICVVQHHRLECLRPQRPSRFERGPRPPAQARTPLFSAGVVFIAHRGQMHDAPVDNAIKDRVSRLCFVVIVIFNIAGAVS
ncbi:MAG: haloacid dehalogenase-like hydrolase [Pseudomonadota bacterium]